VARINFEDEWDNDPRRKNLIRLFVADSSTVEYAEFIADGLAKALWKFAQFHVTAEGAVIPRSTFKQMQAHSKLIEAGVVTEVEDGYFVEGSKRHLSWLHKKKAAGAKHFQALSSKRKQSAALPTLFLFLHPLPHSLTLPLPIFPTQSKIYLRAKHWGQGFGTLTRGLMNSGGKSHLVGMQQRTGNAHTLGKGLVRMR
jgi:hypothetical protein